MRTLLSFLGPLRSPVVVVCAGLVVNAAAFGASSKGSGVQLDHAVIWKR